MSSQHSTLESGEPRRWDDFPFAPRSLPFFYGWIILPCAVVALLMSFPGQTVGVSVFTDSLLSALKLSRVELSTAYMFGTIISALFLPYAGRVYDRFGARVLTPLSAIGLSLTLLMLSVIDRIVAFFDSHTPLPRGVTVMALMVFGFFLLRFFGQGLMTMVPRNMVMKWFVRRRGIVNGLLGVCIAVGFSFLAYAFNILIEAIGWSDAWWYLGIGIGVGVSVIAVLFYRDSPQSVGLLPDGARELSGSAAAGKGELQDGANLAEAKQYFEFWMYCLVPGMAALSVTAVSFHIISIFELAGFTRSEAISVYLPVSVLSSIGILVSGWASDRMKLCHLLRLMALSQVLTPLGLLFLTHPAGYGTVIFGLGLSQATFGLLLGLTWPRLFGVLHLGEIGGFAMSVIVVGSAIGPLLFGVAFEQLGSYAPLELSCLVVGLVLLAGSFQVKI